MHSFTEISPILSPVSRNKLIVLSVCPQHVMRWRKNAAVVILLFGVLIGLALTPLLTCIANYLVNTFMDEGDADQGGGDGEKRQQEDEKEEDDQKAKRD